MENAPTHTDFSIHFFFETVRATTSLWAVVKTLYVPTILLTSTGAFWPPSLPSSRKAVLTLLRSKLVVGLMVYAWIWSNFCNNCQKTGLTTSNAVGIIVLSTDWPCYSNRLKDKHKIRFVVGQSSDVIKFNTLYASRR